ncbi:MAG: hypothetical protein ACR2M0_10500 [Chloroflexia bacterium]
MRMSLNTGRKIIYPLMAVMMVAVFGLSLYENWAINNSDASPFLGVPAQPGILPRDDDRGAFLQLHPGSDSRFPSSLVQLIESDQPDLAKSDRILQVDGASVDSVVINQASIDVDTIDYRVYPVGKEALPITSTRMPGGKLLLMRPKSGEWTPGAYLVDVPSGGMFDNSRVYYAFTIR